MEIKYTNHLKNRLKLRQIDYDLPKKIYGESKERYYVTETGHYVAVLGVDMYGKTRDVIIVYSTESDNVRLLTIHPLKAGQKEARVQTGRWRKAE